MEDEKQINFPSALSSLDELRLASQQGVINADDDAQNFKTSVYQTVNKELTYKYRTIPTT